MLTFCPIENNTNTDIYLKEIESIPHDKWHFDKFRNCYILPLWNPGGQSGIVDPSIQEQNQFSDICEYCPELIKFIKPIIYKLKGRLTVLKTLPNQKMNIHIDCKKSEIGTEQYKWRMVLKGNRNGIFFLDENLNKIYPNSNYSTYMMDGGHPHSISDNTTKITVCIGSKWTGDPKPDDLLLEKSISIKYPKIIEDKWCP
jgi:hypothetical protein